MVQTSIVCLEEPSEPAVNSYTVYEHLNSIVDCNTHPADSVSISTLIEAATDRLHGPNGLLNRALLNSTWKATFNRFDAEIAIPLPRCQSVQAVEYLNAQGETVTIDPADYRVTGLRTDACRVRPAAG
jgi:hypothetical protein